MLLAHLSRAETNVSKVDTPIPSPEFQKEESGKCRPRGKEEIPWQKMADQIPGPICGLSGAQKTECSLKLLV